MSGIKFKTAVPNIDETRKKGEGPKDYVKRLAREKSLSIDIKTRNAIVITVDTIIVMEKGNLALVLGKPKNVKDAKRMLRMLSGKWHDVHSAIAVRDCKSNLIKIKGIKSRVKFVKLSKDMIDWYISTNEWIGKAGGYAIQGKGCALIESLEGCLTNIIGLSIPTLRNLIVRI